MKHIAGLLASIPSPSSGTLSIGPLKIHAYGLMIALGVVAGVWLMGRRFEQAKIGNSDDANAIAIWAVIAGVIGSRLYHVATDWQKFEHHLADIPKIWQGGLGIPGGLIFGIGVGVFMMRKRGMPVGIALDAAAPALPLAQAIGRWGNYWNQELYGRPTTLPWGLRIDVAHFPDDPKYANLPANTTFHPTFLYESLSNFVLCAVLITIGRRFKVRPGHLLAMYVMGYGVIRFFVEGLRIDDAHHVGGLRWNQWVAIAMVVGGGIYLFVSSRRPLPVQDEPVAAAVSETESTDAAVSETATETDTETATESKTETETDTAVTGGVEPAVDDDAGDEGIDDPAEPDSSGEPDEAIDDSAEALPSGDD